MNNVSGSIKRHSRLSITVLPAPERVAHGAELDGACARRAARINPAAFKSIGAAVVEHLLGQQRLWRGALASGHLDFFSVNCSVTVLALSPSTHPSLSLE